MQTHDRYRKGSHSLIREINLSVLIGQLRTRGITSRSALATMTGLSKAAVSSLISELVERKFVREVGRSSDKNGRPSIGLELNPAAGCIVSGELGVDHIYVVCTNFAAEFIWQRREPITEGMGQQAIIDCLQSLLVEAAATGQATCGPLLGVALGVSALVDRRTGVLLVATNLGWRKVPLRSILQESFDIPVYVDNEYNIAVLGEYYFGRAQGYDDVLYVGADIGLGGSILHEGLILGGSAALTGRLGHMTIYPDGEFCSCGNKGCWETLVDRRAISRLIRHAVERGRPTVLTELAGSDLSRLQISMVVDAARAGDAVAIDTFKEVGHYLGIGLASLVNVLNPELVVIGNIFELASEFLLPVIKEEFQQHVLCWKENIVEIIPSKHGLDACVIGGVATVYEGVLPQPNRVIRQST